MLSSKTIELARSAEMETSSRIRTIFIETERYLDQLAKHVKECKRVDEAARYCRWLEMSGVMALLNSQDALLKASSPPLAASALRRKLRDVIFDCGELFRQGRANPNYSQSDIAEINRKLDLILNSSDVSSGGYSSMSSARSAESSCGAMTPPGVFIYEPRD